MFFKKIFSFQKTQERLRIAFQRGTKTDIPFLLESAQHLKSPGEQLKWLEQTLIWIRLSGGSETTSHTSLKFLLLRLEQNPSWKANVETILRHMLLECSFVRLFADTGVHRNYGFLSESLARLVRRIFPTYSNPAEMEMVIDRVFHQHGDADWLASLPPETHRQIETLVFGDPVFNSKFREHLISDALESSAFLCIRASALSIQRDLMDRAGRSRIMQIPPLRLRWHLEDFFSDLLSGKSQKEVEGSYQKVKEEIENSRHYVQDVLSHLEQYGVSVQLVFSIESITSILNRIETLTRLSMWLRFDSETFDPWAFFVNFVRDSASEKQITPLLQSNFHLLSRKIVEKSSATGENYITGNRKEYLAMFYAALGGGFVTAFTGLAKYLGPSESAPFVLGLYAAMNYSICFVLMHHLHFKLATKQPAMTAAALAERLRAHGSQEQPLGDFVDLVARISRSQFAAVAGNLLAVVPTALAIDYLFRFFLGASVISPEYSRDTLQSFHPFATLTIFYAAITGGLLWASGLISGWVENSYVYFQVSNAIGAHPFLVNFLGEKRLARLAQSISVNLSGWASSIALGILLAFVPVIGRFFGLPLDVRHVTLTTGAASFSASSVGWENISASSFTFTALGIALIGAMNFGVSFALALHIAIRANEVPKARMTRIGRACARELIQKPAKFFFP